MCMHHIDMHLLEGSGTCRQAICGKAPLHIPQQSKDVALAVPERPVHALHEGYLQQCQPISNTMYSSGSEVQ